MIIKCIQDYADIISNLKKPIESFNERPLPESLLLERNSSIEIYYAPFDYVTPTARVVIVGITPGRTQALLALNKTAESLAAGKSPEQASMIAKSFASFGGSMRNNLVRMLDCIGLHQHLGLTSTMELFTSRTDLAHFTSALQYPTFLGGTDYNGAPSMISHPMLRDYLETYMRWQLTKLPSDVLFLPLGPKPTEALQHLVNSGDIASNAILEGLPHPSGANAERVAVFIGSKSPADASIKTNAPRLIAARERLSRQLAS